MTLRTLCTYDQYLRALFMERRPETVFVLRTERKQKGDKQHEIDMPNTNPMRMVANTPIFHLRMLGLASGIMRAK